MRLLIAAFTLSAAACAAEAVQIKSYEGRIDVAAQGASQARILLQIEDAAPGTLLVPLAPALKPEGAVKLDSAPLGTTVKVVTVGERPHLALEIPEAAAGRVALQLSFPVKKVLTEPKARSSGKKTLPENSLLLNHAFVHTQPYTIDAYRMAVVLPEGARVHIVREALPKARRSEIEPRVGLDGRDGRQGALLQLGDIKQGDSASMSLEVVPDHRSLTWLIVGLALVGAYLYGFRHLVLKPRS
ncbi:MAG TPA: hypothetical protein P5024_11880 [Burkholderiaceae bacterium]|jgi:hypothetical protein|nr:hypothetical protein [Burkholderiaceae bacterium]HRZ60111.1 hypothetical protein [Rubrivivax sp.]